MNIAGLEIGRKRRIRRPGGFRFRSPNLRHYLTIGSCLILVAATFYAILRPPAVPADGEATGGRTQTRWGPLDDGDRLLLVKVRQAGLWEMPTDSRPSSGRTARRSRTSAAASPPSTECSTTTYAQSPASSGSCCPAGPMPISRAGWRS